jgi:anaerobic ribonucleoside-triphosphate reductase activating protein
MQVEDLVETIQVDSEEIEGLTISGGEPLEQPEGLYRLLEGVRESTPFSVILFSGLDMEEIRALPQGPDILRRTDVLIAGRYVEALRLSRGLRGSLNQRIHLLSDRYRLQELEETPVAEVSVDGQGRITISGIDPPALSGTGPA